jgi:ribosomal protein S18 acetylase RimI-like enzyme
MQTLDCAGRRVEIGLSNGNSDLDAILALQRQNLARNLSAELAAQQGFVTVVHDKLVLRAMHALAPSVVAKQDETVVGYALSMPVETRQLLPILEPMFEQLEQLHHHGVPLSQLRYYVMGQICIASSCRGQGIFEALYTQHRAAFADRFDLLVTEVSQRNKRSLQAHRRTGFEALHTYRDATDEWVILGWPL